MVYRFLLLFSLLTVSAQAILFYDKNNNYNTTDPGNGVPFKSVAKITNVNGTDVTGSAVYLGNGYMLTANHVDMTSFVSFDGTTTFTIDTGFTAVQVAAGLDLKIFRLEDHNINIDPVLLYNGNHELAASATMVGWGVGRSSDNDTASTTVSWGGKATSTKRWGTNKLEGIAEIKYLSYDYEAFYTLLDQVSGEAATTLYDSGSGLFQKLNGSWYLIGIATAVGTNGSSLFGTTTIIEDDGSKEIGPDANFFVRISTYYNDINNIINAQIPEPGITTLLFISGMLGLLRRRR